LKSTRRNLDGARGGRANELRSNADAARCCVLGVLCSRSIAVLGQVICHWSSRVYTCSVVGNAGRYRDEKLGRALPRCEAFSWCCRGNGAQGSQGANSELLLSGHHFTYTTGYCYLSNIYCPLGPYVPAAMTCLIIGCPSPLSNFSDLTTQTDNSATDYHLRETLV